jgi:hypothetical protein
MDGAQQDELAMQNDGIASAYPKRAGTNFLLALGAYFVLQIILRTSSPAVLDLDESEQVLAFQHLQLGYGSQPPLYAWLQWLMFSVFGVNRFALSFLKNLLLFGTYLAMFHAARSLVGITGGIIVAASLVLFPQIGWESQRDLTHSVLMTCMAALTLWCYFALLHHPGKMRHALFGLLIGLGLQSKYNFALFALALTMASLLVREHRERLWSRRAWISLAVIAIAVAPHGLWLLNHLDAATRSTLEKMNGSDAGYIGNVVRGLGSMVSATFLFVTPLWMVYTWVFWRRRAQAEAKVDDPHARFFSPVLPGGLRRYHGPGAQRRANELQGSLDAADPVPVPAAACLLRHLSLAGTSDSVPGHTSNSGHVCHDRSGGTVGTRLPWQEHARTVCRTVDQCRQLPGIAATSIAFLNYQPRENSHEDANIGAPRLDGFRARPGLHGHVGVLRPA